MNDPVTISESFIKYLEDESIATFGTDLFLGSVPKNAPDTTYWVITAGGNPIQRLRTGESLKQYFISVYYRTTDHKALERKMFELEEKLNCTDCINLEGFQVVEVECTQFPSDLDVDNEERRVALLQTNIKIYKEEC